MRVTILLEDGSIADPYRNYIALSRYARWLPDEKRRETWAETVDRYFEFMVSHLEKKFGYRPHKDIVSVLRTAVREHEVLPSMRGIMTAGPAAERSNIAFYNCAYHPADSVDCFWETLYILMNGTGVGYSVERRYVDQLPAVPETITHKFDPIVVEDSKEGWALAYKEFLYSLWYHGVQRPVDLSQIRPAGSRLRTFGGRASGPEPFGDLINKTTQILGQARGRKLRPIEVHDLMCHIANVVVVGGVRRSAMIALSDLDDEEMATAKSGSWWVNNPQRRLANISAVYYDGVTREQFDREWAHLVASGSGERGIFNRSAAQRQAAKYGRRDPDADYGTNPCSEIILRPRSFCNLTSVTVRPEDDVESLREKVAWATILGTWQSTLTNFPLLREEWRRNAEEERLLGVSLNGVYGNSLLYGPGRERVLDRLRQEARHINRIWAGLLGINESAAITCVKPEGTSSQLVGCSSGVNPWHSRYYIRNVRGDKMDPLAQLMVDSGVPHEEEITDKSNWVFSFPIKAPEGAITREDISAIDHLELWLDFQRHWCEHKPSVTINVRKDEWEKVGEWVWQHLGELSGVSFLPYSEHTYKQAPYQEIDKETYQKLVAGFPEVRWADLVFYERDDTTEGAQILACVAGNCDL